MAGAQFQFDALGPNPFLGFIGPSALGSGVPQPQFKPGTVVRGDRKSEFVSVTLVLGSTTTLTPGDLYQFDKDFNATVVTTSAAVRGYNVGVIVAYQPGVLAGTYYGWLQQAGNGPVKSSGIAAGAGETTATAGLVNFAATATTGAKSVQGMLSFMANTTFTATTATGSNVLTLPSTLNDVYVGASVAGTGIPGSTIITAIDPKANTVTISNAATANGTAVTVTCTGVLTGNIGWPYIDKTN